MTSVERISFEVVDYVPEELKEGVVYISFAYGTAMHLCCCGCKSEVVTPMNDSGWHVSIERGSISLHPSIGNWSFPCRSHYWIRRGKVFWASEFSAEKIRFIQRQDRAAAAAYARRENQAIEERTEPRSVRATIAAKIERLCRSLRWWGD